MPLIGMLHYRRHPSKVKKAYAFAATAKAEGIDFFFFSPSRVNLDEETIRGYAYEKGEWVEKIFPFPDIIYNAGTPGYEKGREIYDELLERIPYTSHSVGSKISVYERIKKGKTFSQYLLPTESLESPDRLFEFLDRYEKVIIKPVSGHQGLGVIFIEKHDQEFQVIEGDDSFFFDKRQLKSYVRSVIEKESYLIQPYLSCRMRTGQSYDFRLHVQKDGKGKWTITSIYPKIGRLGSIVTNISSGGYTTDLDSFLFSEFDREYYDIKRYLEQFALALAAHMDYLYDVSFDELGIDVGLDDNQRIWIYEVNWRPGTPPVMDLDLDVARNTLLYAAYLARQKKQSSRRQ